MGTLTSWNHLGHSRPVTGLLYLSLLPFDFINKYSVIITVGNVFLTLLSSTVCVLEVVFVLLTKSDFFPKRRDRALRYVCMRFVNSKAKREF